MLKKKVKVFDFWKKYAILNKPWNPGAVHFADEDVNASRD